MPIPKIINQPATHQAIQNGVHKIVNAIRPTLGPLPRRLIYKRPEKLELLDDGGIIARRIIQLASRPEDVGAMLLRQVLWRVNQEVGDGAATTAVLFEAIYDEGLRFVAAGCNTMRLRQYLMDALEELNAALFEQSQMLIDARSLQAIALSVCYDEGMAAVLGEVMDTVGQYGQVDIRTGHGRGIEREYVDGSYWKGGVQSKLMIEGKHRPVVEMTDAAILVTDIDVVEPNELVSLMQLVMRSGIKDILLVVKSISDKGLSVILDKRIREKVNVIAVKINNFLLDELTQAYQDITILTGGNPVLQAAGQSLEHVKVEDFGYARWVWADANNFGFAGGKGDPRQIRDHVRYLRNAYPNVTDKDRAAHLLKRLGVLQGGFATVRVGGSTDFDIKMRKELAERTVRALRRAIAGGVISGGGTALLRCQAMLKEKATQSETLEQRAAYQILAKAVEAPIRTLLQNSGYDPSEVLAQLQHCEPEFGFDLLQRSIVNMSESGILDVTHVQKEALRRAVSSAALALTVDVMVLHRNPEEMVEP